MSYPLLVEIGVEELPASFVDGAVAALPGLLTSRFRAARLDHGDIHATGTPRRLAVTVSELAPRQPDLDEEVLGPPARVAFDAGGAPTKAAIAFASKAGVDVSALYRANTPKGEYVAARRVERGRPTEALLPDLLAGVLGDIPFRKSMRWSDGDTAFGRPVRWLVALLGDTAVPFRFAGVTAGRSTFGHRFLSPAEIRLENPAEYGERLRAAHVIVEIEERKRIMIERLHAAAAREGGSLIEDDFLVHENVSLVEEPQVIAGSFDPAFLALPERVILEVAKGHQRYFGLRGPDGRLLPKYLAVVNTAVVPENVRRGNDRVMRARLADAKFFFDEDRKVPLGDRRKALDGIVFHQRLGTVGDKVRRIERLAPLLGEALSLDARHLEVARAGAALSKCDLVTLMVGEFPELQGEVGMAYAAAQGTDPDVASVIRDHYAPRTAEDAVAVSSAAALVAIADRLDTLTGSCAVNVMPTGTSDPLALRRAAIGLLRTLLEHEWDLSLSRAVGLAYAGFEGVKVDIGADDTTQKLTGFLAQRLRGILSADLPADVVDACLATSQDRPVDVARRARALARIQPEARASAGEVFKRAANIAKGAPEGEPRAPGEVSGESHPTEVRLFEAFSALREELGRQTAAGDYAAALSSIAAFAPALAAFFDDVFVMVEDAKVRENRLRLMRSIHRTCSSIANFNLLAADAAS